MSQPILILSTHRESYTKSLLVCYEEMIGNNLHHIYIRLLFSSRYMTFSSSTETFNLTPIQKFYSGSSIFITGGTGFLGTILIEKLLRCCSDLSTIYILARNKKGKNLQSRIDDLFEGPVFDRLKREFPKFRHKVVGIGGDCSLPNLGINLQDRQMLINEVRMSKFYHKFNSHMNFIGIRR